MTVAFRHPLLRIVCFVLSLLFFSRHAFTQDRIYSAHIVEGGPALRKPLPAETAAAKARSFSVWMQLPAQVDGKVTVVQAGEGDHARRIGLRDGRPYFHVDGTDIVGADTLAVGVWHLVVAVEDGTRAQLYVDGRLAGTGQASTSPMEPMLIMAPIAENAEMRFSGDLGAVSVVGRSLSEAEVGADYGNPPYFANELMEENAKPWPVQTHQQAGYTSPQTLDQLPHGAPAARPVRAAVALARPALRADGALDWTLAGGWTLLNSTVTAPPVAEAGVAISKAGFSSGAWIPATVPGTVLSTLVDQGIYPDPDYGLNNLAIPESLNKHDWWYRTEFALPAVRAGRHLQLNFAGINYHAEVWLNGSRLGEIRGAFRRGSFDVTGLLHPGVRNAVAVRITPPPHPGIPHEQSIRGGPGENGGEMVIDGPTFVASEGWDWIPAMRDRNSGIWQAVSLHESGDVSVGDPRIVTRLPLPDTSNADVSIDVPMHNASSQRMPIVVTAAFEGVGVTLHAIIAPGDSVLHLTPAEHPELHLSNPRLWWPNGYGKPELYHLTLRVETAAGVQDERAATFGVREITYELSLFDRMGKLRRVEAVPQDTVGKGYDAVDVHHAGMRQTENGWASSMGRDAEGTSALRPVNDEPGMTDLVVKVNGVRIAIRGGNWGMDDARKRVSREHLEPYFRLNREASLNVIRNWVGQDTEDVFYDLADEYGLLVWNDFWASTQNYNAEPGDLGLFVDNARDVVRRYRNHPSILLWCGRNEGVPPPALNDALIDMLREEDGTRFYSPSSNVVNLRNSGPYSWQNPALYFTKLNRGFSVELGISSFPTMEAFTAAIAPADRWPISDAWAYHDWHQAGGGDTHELMKHMEAQLGTATSLAEFERRAQLFNYVDHQAIFEGFYQHLWKPNSGRMIWMTHPAWPSTMWQMYSSDYDTQASFYAIKKANASVHIQMDLSDGSLAVVNTTRDARAGMQVTAVAYSPGAREIARVQQVVEVGANNISNAGELDLQAIYAKSPLAFIRLELKDSGGARIADNFYWIAKSEGDFRGLNQLAPAELDVHARKRQAENAERVFEVELANHGQVPAITSKLTLLHEDGTRILPAYFSDNYVSLLPGETRTLRIHVPERAISKDSAVRVDLRGWNVPERAVQVE